MDFKQIDYLLEIRRTMSLNRAAESLKVSQPTLSYQLRRIEAEVGFDIFERTRRSLSLTPAGEQFCIHLSAIRTEMRKAVEQCQNIGGRYREGIRVGLPVRPALRLLPEAIRRLSREFPDVLVTPVFHPYDEFDRFLAGETDLEFTEMGRMSRTPGVREVHLYYSAIYLIVRDDDPLASRAMVGEEDLLGRTLMVGGGSPPQLEAVQRRVIESSDVGYYNSHDHDTTLVNVAAGSGVCLSPGFLRGDDPGYRWIPFDCPERFDCGICAMEKEDRPSVLRLIEILEEVHSEYSGPMRPGARLAWGRASGNTRHCDSRPVDVGPRGPRRIIGAT
ncbi:MAG: LysR family transcriptional regulator [Candidatus Methanomethylophilaceae archaeon]|nr:LysR family transcriptional regulator [Candidatus Methanomethylophilaceae archaeon]